VRLPSPISNRFATHLENMPPKLLVITRNYPPQIGGLENYSFNLVAELKRHMSVKVIALGQTKPHLIWFMPAALIMGLIAVRTRPIRLVHLCDGLLAPIGRLLKVFSKTRVTVSVHGLDITFPHSVYQRVVPPCLKRLDRIVCVSQSTRDECLRRTIPGERCVVIPNGIHPEEIYLSTSRSRLIQEVEAVLRCPLGGKKILLTVGRLVKRKGVEWFVENVLPRLDQSYVYVVVGTGPEYSAIQEMVRRKQLGCRILLAGRQPDRLRNCLLNIADAFIMPNIYIPGDVEGFGIAALEAGACGLPVIASNIQGIRDAVIDDVTGYRVGERDVEGFLSRIQGLDLDRRRVRSEVASRFSWNKIGLAYAEMFSAVESEGIHSGGASF
jgi:glycosyltransferase involved in cell wall biosynthesis